MLIFGILLERSSCSDMFQYALHIPVLWIPEYCRVSVWGLYQRVPVQCACTPDSECTTILNMGHYQDIECVLVLYAFTSILRLFQYIVCNALSFLQEEACPDLTSLCNIKICKVTLRLVPYSKINSRLGNV